MLASRQPLLAAGIAVGLALLVAAAWCGRSRPVVTETALAGTISVRLTRHDRSGMPSKPVTIREPSRVRAVVAALGVDAQPALPCPADYASADVGLLLSGGDVYARRNVYVWGLEADAGPPSVVVVTTAGCRGGPPPDGPALRRELGSDK